MRIRGIWIAALITTLVSSAGALADGAFKTVDFAASDGIEVRADLYDNADSSGALVLLFHQAGWSRGEYREIAPKLVELGYRVMAVDQRSGRGVNGVVNETRRRASSSKKPTGYLDAYADVEAALRYGRKTLHADRIIAWGSSYSASLVIRLAAEHPKEVTAAVAFSPGEYFTKPKGKDYIQSFASRVSQPLFITSSKKERSQVKPLFDAAPSDEKVLFTPASKGQHGSRALWAAWPDDDVYWAALKGFLREYAPPK